MMEHQLHHPPLLHLQRQFQLSVAQLKILAADAALGGLGFHVEQELFHFGEAGLELDNQRFRRHFVY